MYVVSLTEKNLLYYRKTQRDGSYQSYNFLRNKIPKFLSKVGNRLPSDSATCSRRKEA